MTERRPTRDLFWDRLVVRRNDSYTDRLKLLRRRWRLLLRILLATGLSYFLAHQVMGHTQAFFAPIAAIITILAGVDRRAKTMAQLVLGVSIGVLVGELFIAVVGRGAWQMSVIVTLALVISTLLGLKGLALTQAATSSVLLAAVVPFAGQSDPALTRFLDALVGGAIGLLMVVLIPRNPVRDIDREVQLCLTRLSAVLKRIAAALRDRDADLADRALDDARSMQPLVDLMVSTAANVREVAQISPMRWRQREHVDLYVGTIQDLDNAVRDGRVMARRASALIRHDEPLPPDLAMAVEALAGAVGVFADGLAQREDFEKARNELVQAARMASLALPAAMTMNSAAITAQVRSLAADLLYASGYTRDQIDERLEAD